MSYALSLPLEKGGIHYRELVDALNRVDRNEWTIQMYLRSYIIPEIHIEDRRGDERFGFYINDQTTASRIIKDVIMKAASTARTDLMTKDELEDWDKCKDLFDMKLVWRGSNKPYYENRGTGFIYSILALQITPQPISIYKYGPISNPRTEFAENFMKEFERLYIEENLKLIFETAV